MTRDTGSTPLSRDVAEIVRTYNPGVHPLIGMRVEKPKAPGVPWTSSVDRYSLLLNTTPPSSALTVAPMSILCEGVGWLAYTSTAAAISLLFGNSRSKDGAPGNRPLNGSNPGFGGL